jgi:actin-related protein
MTVRKDIVVLDCGGSTIKAGFAGDDKPAWCAASRARIPLAL